MQTDGPGVLVPSKAKRERALQRRRTEREQAVARFGQLLRDVAAEPAADFPTGLGGSTGGPDGVLSSSAGLDVVEGSGGLGREARLRRRAERAEAELADLRRQTARTVLRLRREAAYWRLRAEGLPDRAAAEEARRRWPAAGAEARER